MNTLHLWMAIFPLFIAPIAAIVAGGVTWAMTRRERPEDGELVRHFLVVMAMVSLLAAGVLSSHWLQRKLDPTIALREHFEALPVTAALRSHMPYEWEKFAQNVGPQIARRAPVLELQQATRRQSLPLARRLLPFGTREAALGYARALVPVLEALGAADPAQCVGLAWPKAPAQPTDWQGKVNAGALGAYDAAVAQLIKNSSLSTPKPPPDTPDPGGNPLQDLQRAYASLSEATVERYGTDVLAKLRSGAVADVDPALACRATIDVLERSLAQPPGVARSLTTNLLRT